ncbi:MAG: hypothetical protein HY677_04240, partial [Chloroflexi bacterium]|nr:hypothetical protein [Chloroflexota bacterium]
LYRAIKAIDDNKEKLPKDLYNEADQAIRAQLRRHLEREDSWIEEAFAGRSRF